jgi:hypothetical protein
MSMGKFVIFMWLCTATVTIDCRMIETERVLFKDVYDCTLYGYTHSARLMRDFGREDVNKMNLYTKFLCLPENSGPRTNT